MSETQPRTSAIKRWRDGESWKATEPGSDADVVGRGSTELEAVANYIEFLREADDE